MIFGLMSGLHVDPAIFNGKDRVFWPVATANVSFPMILGCLAGYSILLYPEELLPGASPAVFIAAMGISLSMTALPVLAAILGEMNLLSSRIGQLALGVAGVNNITLWILLGILLTTAAAGRVGHGHGAAAVYLLISAPVYLLFMVRVVRPTLAKLGDGPDARGGAGGHHHARCGCGGRGYNCLSAGNRSHGIALYHRGFPSRHNHARQFAQADP